MYAFCFCKLIFSCMIIGILFFIYVYMMLGLIFEFKAVYLFAYFHTIIGIFASSFVHLQSYLLVDFITLIGYSCSYI